VGARMNPATCQPLRPDSRVDGQSEAGVEFLAEGSQQLALVCWNLRRFTGQVVQQSRRYDRPCVQPGRLVWSPLDA
jgi:hypothetical protein